MRPPPAPQACWLLLGVLRGPPWAGAGAASRRSRHLPFSSLSWERKVRGVWPGPRGAGSIPCLQQEGSCKSPHLCLLALGCAGSSPARPEPQTSAASLPGWAWAPLPLPHQHRVPGRLIELHSPDSRNTLILRCKDTATAHSWFTALHANIAALLPQVLAELNAMLGAGGATAGSREVKHIAWLAEQVRTAGDVPVPGL